MKTTKCERCNKEYEFRGDPDPTGKGLIPLPEVEDLIERIKSGREVPAGECPDCGALCYLVRDKVMTIEAALELIIDTARSYLFQNQGSLSLSIGNTKERKTEAIEIVQMLLEAERRGDLFVTRPTA